MLITSVGGFVVPFLAICLTTERDNSASLVGLTRMVLPAGEGLAVMKPLPGRRCGAACLFSSADCP